MLNTYVKEEFKFWAYLKQLENYAVANAHAIKFVRKSKCYLEVFHRYNIKMLKFKICVNKNISSCLIQYATIGSTPGITRLMVRGIVMFVCKLYIAVSV